MKKVLSIVLVAILAMAMFAPLTVSADDPKSFNVPKALTVPVIDGVANNDEWANALVVEMKKGASYLRQGADTTIPDSFEGGTFKFMWTEEGIWFTANIADNTEPGLFVVADNGSYNQGDGIQFNIYGSRDISGSTFGELLFFSYNPKADDGKPYVGEHFVYGDGATGGNVPAAKIASVMSGTSYVIEGLIPTEAFAKIEVSPVTIASGAKFFMNNIVMENDGQESGASIISDNEWFNGALANEYVLVDSGAGIDPAPPTEAPAEAVPVEAAGGGEAADAEVAPAVQAVVAPQTGDGTMIFVLIALLGAAVTVVSFRKAKGSI